MTLSIVALHIESYYAECRDLLIMMLNVKMLCGRYPEGRCTDCRGALFGRVCQVAAQAHSLGSRVGCRCCQV